MCTAGVFTTNIVIWSIVNIIPYHLFMLALASVVPNRAVSMSFVESFMQEKPNII